MTLPLLTGCVAIWHHRSWCADNCCWRRMCSPLIMRGI